LVIVSWYKTCKPLSQGGLSIRSLSSLNETSNLKNFRNSTQAGFKSEFLENRRTISHHIHSSIWSNIKGEFDNTSNHSSRLIGSRDTMNFWRDNWCGGPLSTYLNLP